MVLDRVEGRLMRSKHIRLRYHYIRENLLTEEIMLTSPPTDEKFADFLLNPFPTDHFEYFMKLLVKMPSQGILLTDALKMFNEKIIRCAS